MAKKTPSRGHKGYLVVYIQMLSRVKYFHVKELKAKAKLWVFFARRASFAIPTTFALKRISFPSYRALIFRLFHSAHAKSFHATLVSTHKNWEFPLQHLQCGEAMKSHKNSTECVCVFSMRGWEDLNWIFMEFLTIFGSLEFRINFKYFRVSELHQ